MTGSDGGGGGARVAGSALRAGIVNKIAHFAAPKILGAGRAAIAGFEVETLADAPQLELVAHTVLGQDVLFEGYLAPLPLKFV